MAFDRSKYKGANRDAQKQVQASEPKNGNSKAGWHYVEEGRNEFRIAPPHNPEHSSYELYRTANINCTVPVWENGEKTDKTEVKGRKIVSATVHSNSLKDLKQEGDPIELYVKMVKDHAFTEIKDKVKRNKYLAPINGYRGRDGKWVWGITAKSSFLAYAWSQDGTLGKIELYSSWVRDMDKLTAELELEGEVIEVDPFSNIDEGYPLIIMKDKNKDNKWEYVIQKGQPSRAKKESFDQFFERTAITDSQLEELSKQKSLNESYVDSYQLRDFEMAVDGLKMFDEKNNYGMFSDDDFLDKLEKIHDIVEAEDKIRNADTGETNSFVDGEADVVPEKTKKIAKEVVEEEEEVVETADPYTFIVAFVKEYYGDDYVNQIPKRGPKLKKWYKLAQADEDLPLEEPAEEEVKEEPIEKVSKSSLSSQISNLRKRK